jgi:hypothetical protein
MQPCRLRAPVCRGTGGFEQLRGSGAEPAVGGALAVQVPQIEDDAEPLDAGEVGHEAEAAAGDAAAAQQQQSMTTTGTPPPTHLAHHPRQREVEREVADLADRAQGQGAAVHARPRCSWIATLGWLHGGVFATP